MKRLLILTALLLASCGTDEDTRIGGVSADDAKTLDETAAKLDDKDAAASQNEAVAD